MARRLEELRVEPALDVETRAEKDRFEKDFVAVNCEIQNLRSENEALADEICARQESLVRLEAEVKEKDSLIKFFSDKITHFTLN